MKCLWNGSDLPFPDRHDEQEQAKILEDEFGVEKVGREELHAAPKETPVCPGRRAICSERSANVQPATGAAAAVAPS